MRVPVIAVLLLASNVAIADDAGILRCRAIKEAAARLACYDALAVPSSAPAAPAGSPSRPAEAAPAASLADRFGLKRILPAPELSAIESTIPGRFEGWNPKDRIRLANGQVWKIADNSSGQHWIENPKVRVRRGALGAFYLEIEGTSRSPRVTRER